MNFPTLYTQDSQAPQSNLQRLLWVRSLFLGGLGLLLAMACWGLQLELPYLAMGSIAAGLLLINIIVWTAKAHYSATDRACFLQLLIDLAGISLLFYCSGGANNPFIAYYLVPLSLSAATLPRRYTLSLFGVALTAYTLLFFFNIPLQALAPVHNHGAEFGHPIATAGQNSLAAGFYISPHTLGMWFNFLLSATLIIYFVAQMAAALRQQDAQLASLREEALRDEQLLAVATLAAGTAHELGTPLTTLKTLIGEMQLDYPDQADLQADLSILKHQIGHCTQTLKQLHEQASQRRHQQAPVPVKAYCEKLLDQWLLLRPDVTAAIHINPEAPPINAIFDPTIAQSISNLLNNAADACPDDIEIFCDWDTHALQLMIDDKGSGIDPGLIHQLSHPYASSKGSGRGLGLFLTHATLTRYGGEVHLQNRPQGGTRTHLRLPLQPEKREAL